MKRYKLTIEYDGTEYVGWQRQLNGVSVQQRLEEALAQMLGVDVSEVSTTASGRTDAGVHARGQAVHFDAETSIPTDKIPFALNTFLPPDISVLDCAEVSSDFNARFSAKRKTYCYRLYFSPHRHPTLSRNRCHVVGDLDFDAMCRAAEILVGKHDFKCFEASGSVVKDTVREIYSLKLKKDGENIDVYVCGNGFLYNMVRIIAGTLVYVGLGKLSADYMPYLLEMRNRTLAGKTMPACGLTLESVEYPD